jgi:hypothetical protein
VNFPTELGSYFDRRRRAKETEKWAFFLCSLGATRFKLVIVPLPPSLHSLLPTHLPFLKCVPDFLSTNMISNIGRKIISLGILCFPFPTWERKNKKS